jgi:hypothetical protein
MPDGVWPAGAGASGVAESPEVAVLDGRRAISRLITPLPRGAKDAIKRYAPGAMRAARMTRIDASFLRQPEYSITLGAVLRQRCARTVALFYPDVPEGRWYACRKILVRLNEKAKPKTLQSVKNEALCSVQKAETKHVAVDPEQERPHEIAGRAACAGTVCARLPSTETGFHRGARQRRVRRPRQNLRRFELGPTGCALGKGAEERGGALICLDQISAARSTADETRRMASQVRRGDGCSVEDFLGYFGYRKFCGGRREIVENVKRSYKCLKLIHEI